MKVNVFSLILKPSTISGAGVGVFAAEDIAKDTEIFNTQDIPQSLRKKSDVPSEFWGFGIEQGGGMSMFPKDFNKMERVCHMNHSSNPNVGYLDTGICFASRDIKKGEEILMDYNDIGEPEETKEDYYKNG